MNVGSILLSSLFPPRINEILTLKLIARLHTPTQMSQTFRVNTFIQTLSARTRTPIYLWTHFRKTFS